MNEQIMMGAVSHNHASFVFMAMAHSLQEKLNCNQEEAQFVLDAMTMDAIETTKPLRAATTQADALAQIRDVTSYLSKNIEQLLKDPVPYLQQLEARMAASQSITARSSLPTISAVKIGLTL